jgi:glutathione S-transferase
MALVLYAHPLSSYSQKALIALYELDLPFEFKVVEPSRPEVHAELLRLWPFGKFPVLVDDGKVIPEASLIIAHLDAAAGGNRLVPAHPALHAEMWLMDRVFDNYVATPQAKIVLDRLREPAFRDPKGIEEAHALLDTSYAWLEGRVAGRNWAAGGAFSLAIAARHRCSSTPIGFTRSGRGCRGFPPT